MSYNPQGSAQIGISVFGGRCTEMAPTDLPEGVSPLCNDVSFIPGNVFNRPCVKKVFATPLPSGGPSGYVPTVAYGKSYVMPNGGIQNLYLDSNGVLYFEDPIHTPGTYTQIDILAPGSYAKSITAFGREYIAISDSLHGSDVPVQWDGTYLDRVTMDGPGSAPNVTTISLPAVSLASNGTPATLTVTSCTPGGIVSGVYTYFTVLCATSTVAINIGDLVTISGSTVSFYNAVWTVNAVYGNSVVVNIAFVTSTGTGTGGSLVPVASITLTRGNNIVTAYTAAVHNLQVGYQVQITGITAMTVGTSISSVVINNENLPGIATVNTSTAHGLVPGTFVSIAGVNAVTVGTSISSIARVGQLVTVGMNDPHGLSPGSVVTLAGVTPTSFNTTATVANVNSTTVFTFAQVDVDASGSGGTVTLNWPIPDTSTPQYYQVIAAPTATSFQISVSYSDGTWTTGTVTYAWNGTFYVSAILNSTTFQYQQYGPDGNSNSVGTATPYGQISAGRHQCQLMFLTRQGYITAPSPPVEFIADGGQYANVTNIAIGPSNVVARILAFTGAQGAYFYYIPTPAQVNGQIVSTATQIGDNTSTQTLVDFGDNTLFGALATSIPGNDLANQIVIDGALGFGFYGSRLVTWGQRNRIQNLLNMSFDGGYLPSATTSPTGWNITGTGGSIQPTVISGGTGRPAGFAWYTSGSAVLSQSFYEDAYGAPIGTASTQYIFRAWVEGPTTTVTAIISSSSTGFTTSATLNGTGAGSFSQIAFGLAMPSVIPSDMILSITGSVGNLVDEMSIIYAESPYIETLLYGSYVNSPEAFDGVSGKFGSSQDTRKVMDLAEIRQTLYLLTQEPSGRLHQTSDNKVTEPVGWVVDQVAANCGLLSAFALTKSQADDSSASGGEEWFAWASSSGARIFGGNEPDKISQEIQPDWTGDLVRSLTGINFVASNTAWTLNDPTDRVIYFGLPTAGYFAPFQIYTMSYRELDSSSQIAAGAPIHTSYTGKLIATDHVRKWNPWNIPMNGAALMYRSAGQLQPTFFGGNHAPLGISPGYGNVYTLNPLQYTDDDYGQVYPVYVTYFLPSREQEQSLTYMDYKGQHQQLGGFRKVLTYLAAFVTSNGCTTSQLHVSYLCDSLSNTWALGNVWPLVSAPTFDMESAGGSAIGQRIAVRFESRPVGVGVTDNGFSLQKLLVTLKSAGRLSIRGSLT